MLVSLFLTCLFTILNEFERLRLLLPSVRIAGRPVIIISLLVSALGNALLAVAYSVKLMAVARVISGTAQTAIVTIGILICSVLC